MSRAQALVKFKDGSIFIGCYDGTNDILSPWIISEDDLKKDFNGNEFAFDSKMLESLIADDSRPLTNESLDEEDVEIYINYGAGFMWNGTASKTSKSITSELSYDDNNSNYAIADWVKQYYKEKIIKGCEKAFNDRFMTKNPTV